MKRIKVIYLIAIAVLLMAIPNAALANKQVYKASLRGDTDGRGAFVLNHNPDTTFHFILQARSLSSPVFAAHIHSAVDGSILVTLCNNSNPSVPACTPGPDGPNSLLVEGMITPAMMHVSGGQFVSLLQASATYVNVHTSTNPGGEISGPLLPR